MADEEAGAYTWETEYERTWEALTEDDDGSLQASVEDIVHRAKRKRLLERVSHVRLGMMRHLYLVIDMSNAMTDQDLKPTRFLSTLKLLEYFIEEYFDQNPISQLGVIVTVNKRAEKITEIGGNPKRHITAIQNLKDKECKGEPSLQNALELASQTLRHIPSHASREVLIAFASLTSCDPRDISETIKMLQDLNIKCSIIGLAAEVHVCKKICHETQGKYNVILDESHYKDLLNIHISPPSASAKTESSLIRMGFPHHQIQGIKDNEEQPSLCMCHLDSSSPTINMKGYLCPQCKSKYCELPTECKVCGLTLVSAPHLARSYHHLFPLDSFKEIPLSDVNTRVDRYCCACQSEVTEQPMYQCPKCAKMFCLDCDLFTHETLHCCPGCASSRVTQQPSPFQSDSIT